MKKYIILFIILLFPSITFPSIWVDNVETPAKIDGTTYSKVDGVETPAGSACSSCTPGDPADVFCEDVENSGTFWCSYTEDTDGSNTATAENVSGNLSCTDKGSKALEIFATGAQGESANQGKEVSDLTAVDFHGYWCPSVLSMDASSNAAIVEFLGDAVGRTAHLYVRNDSGTYKLRMYVITIADSETVTGPTVASGNCYDIEFTWLANTQNGGTLNVDDTSYPMVENETTENTNLDDILLGPGDSSTNFTGADTLTFQWDIVEVDDDTMSDDCPE